MYFYFGRLRARRFHSQITHVLVSCMEHHEGHQLTLSLGQHTSKQWNFCTLWTVAKLILQKGFGKVCVQVQRHRNDTYSTVIPLGSEGRAFEVWPTVYKKPRQARPRLDVGDGAPRRRPPNKRTGGVNSLGPRVALGIVAPARPAPAVAPAPPAPAVAPGPPALAVAPAVAPAAHDFASDGDETGSNSEVIL
jgi:hypothetical protein